MFRFFSAHWVSVSTAIGVVLFALYLIWGALTHDPLAGFTTTVADRGTVEEIVSVSGVVEAASTAELAFPAPGVVSNVYFKEGDQVAAGDVLASVGAASLVADRTSALAELRLAEADRSELIAGARSEERAVTEQTVATAEADLARANQVQDLAVENARRALYSSQLEARSADSNEPAVAPVISGTYRCPEVGQYRLSVYSSSGESGYAFRLSGLEGGTFTASSKQQTPFGTCGLFALFDATSKYSSTEWVIDVPNTKAPSYITLQNAYDAAVAERERAISVAQDALALAKERQNLENASPRQEALVRASARVAQAQAAVEKIDAQLGDRVIIAPFAGTLTSASILPGETAGNEPVFTVLAADNFELTARIPEIDITKIAPDQRVRTIFDAQTDTVLTGRVAYISPLPVQIDGVAYFEVKLALDEPPAWLRGGLNADVDIITASREDVVRVPNRYITKSESGDSVAVVTSNSAGKSVIASEPITVTFVGNDGYSAIEGLSEGTRIVAP